MELQAGGVDRSAEDRSVISSPAKPPKCPASRSSPVSTPEKPSELPRRAGSRSVAFSVRQVRRAALGLQSPLKSKPCGDGLLEEKKPAGDSRPKRSRVESSIKLPEIYEKLEAFFISMVSSVRLMQIKRQMCTFSKICPKVEYLTDKRFTHRHLAQMKYILSEAIVLKKVLSLDEASCCMKPDIQIAVCPDAIQANMKKDNDSDYSSLNKVFRSRLVEYFEKHPEGDEIPEAALPEPFNGTKIDLHHILTEDPAATSTSSAEIQSSDALCLSKLAAPSHMPCNFQRKFFQKSFAISSKPIEIGTSVPSLESRSFLSPVKSTIKYPGRKELFSPDKQLPHLNSSESSECEEGKPTDCSGSTLRKITALDETPSRSISTPLRLMVSTPELHTPKRCHNPDDHCTPPSKRSVKRPLSLNEQAELEDVPSTLRFLPKSLLLSVKEKEKKVDEECKANLAKAKRRQQMISCLPKLFDTIHLIFQTSNQSVITRQQLVYKIISGNVDIVDKGEIEEQLTLLQEIVPDWISGRTITTGDLVFSVNKAVMPESIRQVLREAK